MRYPRNARIFRGQLDFAPLAGLFFLLILFLLLFAHVYTPGVLVHLDGGDLEGGPTVSVARNGDIHFEGRIYQIGDLERLRAEFKKAAPRGIQSDPNAPKEIVARVREAAGIQLPVADGVSSTTNPTVVVAVSLAGQLFYENQIVTWEQLEERLQAAVAQSKQPLTLVLMADKATEYNVIVQLKALARRVGIRELLEQTRPSVAPRARPQP